METIDRQAAIDLLKPFRDCMVDQHGCPISDVVYALDKAIEVLGQEERKNKWIPCSERLPKAEHGESDTVLVTCESRYKEIYGSDVRWVQTLYYNGGGIWCYDTGELYENNVVAWMPFPKPWKGETDG